MGFSSRFSNGWQMAKTSFTVLNANKELILFPVFSGVSLILIVGSFIGLIFNPWGWGMNADNVSNGLIYLAVFVFYIINYFIVVFFNMALMHCTKLYFDGEEVSIGRGLKFSMSRISTIFKWALLSATVGTILKMVQDNLGWAGKILISLVGIVWSVATYFVIPVLAYENLSPTDAVKRSAAIMKQRWGEGIGANFSFGLIGFVAMIVVGVLAMAVSALVSEQGGIVIFALGFLLIVTVMSALHSIFISALYNHLIGKTNDHFDPQVMDDLFVQK